MELHVVFNVGRWNFCLGPGIFSGASCYSFREGKYINLDFLHHHPPSVWKYFQQTDLLSFFKEALWKGTNFEFPPWKTEKVLCYHKTCHDPKYTNPSNFIASSLRKQGYWRGRPEKATTTGEPTPYCSWEKIWRSPVEVGSLSRYLQGLIDLRWCRIYSINSITTSFYLPQPSLTPMCQHPPVLFLDVCTLSQLLSCLLSLLC